MEGCAEEGDTGVASATSIEDTNFPNKISRHIKIKITADECWIRISRLESSKENI
jgi:hypothetical protein